MRINITSANLERLAKLSNTGDAGFTPEQTCDPVLDTSIEVSDAVAEKLVKYFEDSTDITFDEPAWQYNEALDYLLTNTEQRPVLKLH